MSLSLIHLVREPKSIKEKNPLLLLLHGYGSNEADLFAFAAELPQEYYVVSARAPHSLYSESFAWFALDFSADEKRFSNLEQAASSRSAVLDFLDELLEKYPIDPNEVTLAGFSQGAILSYSIALSKPDKIKQVAALSGYLNTDLLPSKATDVKKLRFFISHGSVDQVVPVQWARKAEPILKEMGCEVVYKEYPVGHGVAPQNFFDFKKWLEN